MIYIIGLLIVIGAIAIGITYKAMSYIERTEKIIKR